jgi:hypothetical protein
LTIYGAMLFTSLGIDVTTDVKLPQNRQSKIPHPTTGGKQYGLVDYATRHEASTTNSDGGGEYCADNGGFIHDPRSQAARAVHQCHFQANRDGSQVVSNLFRTFLFGVAPVVNHATE